MNVAWLKSSDYEAEGKSGITTVDIAELGTNNIVLIDEGHRGWREM